MKVKLENEVLKKYEAKALVYKAMAHPTRLFILELLNEKSLCVCEINEFIDADMSTISKHLSVLKNAGLVESSKKGLQVFYTLATPCVLNTVRCVEQKVL